jgi:hypothetical protein
MCDVKNVNSSLKLCAYYAWYDILTKKFTSRVLTFV